MLYTIGQQSLIQALIGNKMVVLLIINSTVLIEDAPLPSLDKQVFRRVSKVCGSMLGLMLDFLKLILLVIIQLNRTQALL